MKLLQKRPVAAVIMVLAILAGIALGQAKKPTVEAALTGDFLYLVHNEGGVISQDTAEYIEAMNASLFAQTGAQIAVDVVRTTGSEDIMDYAERTLNELGVGSQYAFSWCWPWRTSTTACRTGITSLPGAAALPPGSRTGWRISSTAPWRITLPPSVTTTGSGIPSAH